MVGRMRRKGDGQRSQFERELKSRESALRAAETKLCRLRTVLHKMAGLQAGG